MLRLVVVEGMRPTLPGIVPGLGAAEFSGARRFAAEVAWTATDPHAITGQGGSQKKLPPEREVYQ